MLAITQHNGLRLAEVGFLLTALAGVAFALAELAPADRRIGRLIAGLALTAGSVLLIVATHWGHFG